MRTITKVVGGVCLITVIASFAFIIPGGFHTVAQPSQGEESSCCDKTFAIAAHPAVAAVGAGLRFYLGSMQGQVLWDGRASGKKALVTVGCTTGELEVQADGRDVILCRGPAPAAPAAPTAPANTDYTTVYAEYVVVDQRGSSAAAGEYFIAVDIAD
jgi:hypothetical protein